MLTKEELIHIFGIRLAMALDSKRGGLFTYFSAEYSEDSDIVLNGGDFERKFGTSMSRFQKVMQHFRLAESPTLITTDSVSFIHLLINLLMYVCMHLFIYLFI